MQKVRFVCGCIVHIYLSKYRFYMYLNIGSYVAATCAGRLETDRNGIWFAWTFLHSVCSSIFHQMMPLHNPARPKWARDFFPQKKIILSSMIPCHDPAPRAFLLRLLLSFREYFRVTTQRPARFY